MRTPIIDGKPRECVRTSEQLDDYRTVIAWVHQQDEFDSQRLVVWGSSYSGTYRRRFSLILIVSD